MTPRVMKIVGLALLASCLVMIVLAVSLRERGTASMALLGVAILDGALGFVLLLAGSRKGGEDQA